MTLTRETREKLHTLIDLLPEPELEKAWGTLQMLYGDATMLKAIEEAKHSLTPGDILTKEEALQVLRSYEGYDGAV